jgi:prepilin-type N-terminal cleavage/methylation domain-containing protein
MNKKLGFTLVELMIVVIIVGILAAVAVPLMSANKNKAISTEAVACLGVIDTAASMYYIENSAAPTNTADLVGAGFIEVAELSGVYFNNAQVQACANALGFSTRSLNDGEVSITINNGALTFDVVKQGGQYYTRF